MSIERMQRRALRRLILWRFLGDLAGLPRAIMWGIAQFFSNVEKTVFMLELDAARAYRAISNTDLALAGGETTRYAGLARNAADQRDAHFHPEAYGGDEDE